MRVPVGLTGNRPKKPPLGWFAATAQFPVGAGVPSVAGLNVRPARDALRAVSLRPGVADFAAVMQASIRLAVSSPVETVAGTCSWAGLPME